MVDCYLSWDIEFATRVAERVRDYDVKWFEDPLQNGWATESNRILRDRISPILLATGNLEYHPKAFHDIIHHHATDIIQPEMQWCGGYTPTRWIAAMAKPYNMPVIPHGSSVYNGQHQFALRGIPLGWPGHRHPADLQRAGRRAFTGKWKNFAGSAVTRIRRYA